jgi:hypothetical protein
MRTDSTPITQYTKGESMNMKQPLLIGASIITVAAGSLGTIGLASAATDNSSNSGSSIVDKIATKFNLDKDDVQAVFDQHRSEKHAQMKADQKERLAQAVNDGKLTQAQADYITKTLDEIGSLIGNTTPEQQSSSVREQIKAKMDALRDWAETNNVDKQYIGHLGHGSGGHHIMIRSGNSSPTHN